ncbi:ABC transporter permease [Sphingomonas sp.]|uniref:ABC transporter permease n=1 Tax=Sphingomonas sp. TaxID=28214 RepID=UPI001B2DC379|nr:ABC transporter permease [Sphingomonas sp.]MBO9711672.1 ABC transporter permease [Sphingomonas sp.]
MSLGLRGFGWLPPALLVLTLLAAWQLAVPAFGISDFILPTPLAIAARMASDFPLLLSNALVTGGEVLAGYALAVATGVPLALAAFHWPRFERAAYPLLVALQTVPKVALAPLLILYLGYGWAPKIALAFVISFFPITVATMVGLHALEPGYVDLIRSLGGSERDVLVKVRLPAALPNLFAGLRIAISLAVIGAILGEYVAAEKGLGFLQLQANAQFDVTLNFAAIVAISLLGLAFYYAVAAVERLCVPARA